MFLFRRNGRYHIEYFDESENRIKRISTRCRLKQDALKFLSNFQHELEKRRTEHLEPISLTVFSREMIAYSGQRHSPKTTDDYKTMFNAVIRHLGDVQISNIDRGTIENYVTDRIEESSNYTGRKELAYLSGAFNYAVSRRYVSGNPCRGIKRPSIPERMPLFFSEAEIQTLLRAIDKPDIRDLVEFAVNTGMREMEILTLQWTQVSFAERMVVLDNRGHITKPKKVRTVPLSRTALANLQRRRELSETETVFTLNHKPISQHSITKKFRKYITTAKLNPKLHFHSLRHTFASF